MQLSAKQQSILDNMNPDEKEGFNKLTDSGKVELLETLEAIQADAEKFDSNEDKLAVELSEVSTTGGSEHDEYPILKAGDLGLKEGTKIVALFEGTVPMFTKTKKENWKSKKIEGVVWYFNYHFRFSRMDGKKFGIFASPMLKILKKTFTHSATPNVVEKNPEVKIEYFGLIESIERLKEEFNFELQTGDKAHAFRVYLPKTARIERYAVDCVNYLKNPLPQASQKSEAEDMDDVQKMELAFNKQQQLNGTLAAPQLENKAQ
jgi:hypothetical protein